MFVRSGILAASILLSVTSCATPSLEDAQRHVMPLGQTSFAQYAADAKAWIGANRSFVLDTDEGRKMELEANLPKEYRPEHSDGRGILLVHGLGDSPWSFSDIAQSLAANGILVRTVLLPGCGTQPADMMPATADDWRRFAQTGSIYDYLTYKNQQNTAREDVYAGGNNGPCAAAGQGGRGRPDPDDPDA